MSTSCLRYHNFTLAFLSQRRDRKMTKVFRGLWLRASRRRFKQFIRAFISR